MGGKKKERRELKRKRRRTTAKKTEIAPFPRGINVFFRCKALHRSIRKHVSLVLKRSLVQKKKNANVRFIPINV